VPVPLAPPLSPPLPALPAVPEAPDVVPPLPPPASPPFSPESMQVWVSSQSSVESPQAIAQANGKSSQTNLSEATTRLPSDIEIHLC
jgi:hypothetical protein